MAIFPPFTHCIHFICLVMVRLLNHLPASHCSLQQQQQQQQFKQYTSQSNRCGDTCGSYQIPFPFYMNASCESISDAFRLSCQNQTSLYLNISSQNYQILDFFPDGVLVDFPNTTSRSSCRYNDLSAFSGLEGNHYFGISSDNVVGLYDCEDSSLCKADCKSIIPIPAGGNCEVGGGYPYPACCYPLSDGTSWRVGDGFSVFSQLGCRGFSSWVVPPGPGSGSGSGKHGVKLEWAIPKNFTSFCATNAYAVNATSVTSGIRCQCPNGFVGDALAQGSGCLKSCLKDRSEKYGKDCSKRGHDRRKVEILAGIVASACSVASLTALFCLLKPPIKPNTFDPDRGQILGALSCKTRLFNYHELEEATKGFDGGQKLVHGTKGTMYAGVLGDGSRVAVHKVHCESEREVIYVLSLVEILSAIRHKNLAHLLGCCIDNGSGYSYTALVVYEYPANGTLEKHLHHQDRGQLVGHGLDLYKRMNIAAEIAAVLAFLQYDISPPIFHNDLQSGCIFLDEDFSAKISGFALLPHHSSNSSPGAGGRNICTSDVCSLGMVILEIIIGAKPSDIPTTALQKIRSGKLEEIVDPLLYYHEQPPFRREQIEILADLATRCLLFGVDGKLGIIDVARELMHMTKDSMDGGSRREPALEETFSNSSLLQMISMSPDSLYVP